jgi:hypothetical protein
MFKGIAKGLLMKRKNSIKDLFRVLKIKESDYPPYMNPEQFGLNIERCSLLNPHEVKYSNTTAAQKEGSK